MAATLRVNVPDEIQRSYEIVIQRGLLANIGQEVAQYNLDHHVVVATNTTVRDLYGNSFAKALPNADVIVMEDGEQYKTLDTVREYYDQMISAGADRHTVVATLGGGVVGDTGGYVAASYMRGVRLIQIPTTLLAMVDSSVGGKVGVDLPQGKNLVGSFQNPEYVLIDPDVLKTLPADQWRCGMGEVIKHGFIADETLLDSSLHVPERAEELITRAVQVKINIVEQDPYEKGVRAYLNLGHTFGHAVEQVTKYEWMHGDAVGFGLLAAVKLSRKLDLCSEDLVTHISRIAEQIGWPSSLGDLDPAALWDAMTTDKKWKSGRSRFVLLQDIGQPIVVEGVERDTVINVLMSLK